MNGIAALAMVALLALTGLAAAQEGSDDGTHSGSGSQSGTPTDSPSSGPAPESDSKARECLRAAGDNKTAQAECKREFCREHPAAAACQSGDAPSKPVERVGEWCRDDERSDREQARCRSLAEFRDGREDDHWVSFRIEDGFPGILDYRIGGWLAIASIEIDANGTTDVERIGRTLRVGDNDTQLILHDNPTGHIQLKGLDGNVTLVFPTGATIEKDEHGARIVYGGGQPPKVGLLVTDNATWLGNHTVRLSGFFAFHLPVRDDAVAAGAATPSEQQVEVREGKQAALERRHLGAEVTINNQASSSLVAAGDDEDEVEILAYDDVDVVVAVPQQTTVADPIRIEVSSELEEGRTIVVNLEDGLLPSGDAKDLVLEYFNVNDDGTQTQVYFFEADGGLQDILDPTDDDGRPEYWVVSDANGLQVMVSVPSWSTHAITVASIQTVVEQPSVIVGLVLGVTFSVMAAAGIFWPRKGEDDEF